MKLKYSFRFYKYYLQAHFWYLVGLILLLIFYLILENFIPKIPLEILVGSILSIGTLFYLYRAIKVLKYIPQHFNDYNRLSRIIKEGTLIDPNFKIKKSYLYELLTSKCGKEIVDSLVEDNLIDFS